MKRRSEFLDSADFPYNPGEIVEIEGWPRWKTQVGPFNLVLDIVTAYQKEDGSELGIASFVVMEQSQLFLKYVAESLASASVSHLSQAKSAVLVTVESKGSHLVPLVWQSLSPRIGDKLGERTITLRKGQPKVYAQRPARINGNEIPLPGVNYRSITSQEIQGLWISPNDAEYLCKKNGREIVVVDDFIGRGGTIAAVRRLFCQFGAKTRLVLTIGSDGNYYQESFRNWEILTLPNPLPLRLPTFYRPGRQNPWLISD